VFSRINGLLPYVKDIQKMKKRLGLLFCGLVMVVVAAGCALPIPQTRISFDPATRSVLVQSPKNVELDGLEVLAEGTNFTLSIARYASKHDAAVVGAAAQAQAKQIEGANAAFAAVLQAAGAASR
jgi:hypothetical protein